MVQMDLVDATSRNCHLRMRGSGQEEADCTKWASCRSCNLGMCFVFFWFFLLWPRGTLGMMARWQYVAPPIRDLDVRCPTGAKFYLGQECNSQGKVCASCLTPLRFWFFDQEDRAVYIDIELFIYIYIHRLAEDFYGPWWATEASDLDDQCSRLYCMLFKLVWMTWNGLPRLWISEALMPPLGQLQELMLLRPMVQASWRGKRSEREGLRWLEKMRTDDTSDHPQSVLKIRDCYSVAVWHSSEHQ